MINLFAVTYSLPSASDLLSGISTTSVPIFNEYRSFIFYIAGIAITGIVLAFLGNIIIDKFKELAEGLRKKKVRWTIEGKKIDEEID